MAKDVENKAAPQTGGEGDADRWSKCRVCKKPIPDGAEKCTECGSYQDWRRFVFSSTGLIGAVLGVAVAGITVYTFVFPDAPDPPRLAVAFEECLADRLTILVSNSGGRTATVGRPRFSLRADGATTPIDMTGLSDEDPFTDDDRELEAGETDDQTYPNDVSNFFAEGSSNCEILVRIPVSGSGEQREIGRSCPCGFERR